MKRIVLVAVVIAGLVWIGCEAANSMKQGLASYADPSANLNAAYEAAVK